MTAGTPEWFDALGKIALNIEGLKEVHAGGKAAQDPRVLPMTNSLEATPAAVFGLGPASILAATWQRWTFDVGMSIWIERDAIEDSYALAIAMHDRVDPAFRAHAQAFLADTALQSVVVTGHDGILGSEWPRNSNRWYLVMPWHLEVKVNRAVTYTPA